MATVVEDSPRTEETEETEPLQASGLPKPPGKKLDHEHKAKFFDWLGSLTSNHWAHVLVYLYRLYPVIERPPREGNLRKYNEPFTEDDVYAEFGDGDYEARVNDTNIKGAKNQTVCRCVFKHRDPDNPARFNLRELVISDPSNKSILERLVREGKMTPSGAIIAEQKPVGVEETLVKTVVELAKELRAGSGGRSNSDLALAEAMKIIGTASSESIKIAMSQIKPQDPKQVLEMIAEVKKMFPAPAGDGSNKTLDLVIDLLREQLTATREELAEERKFRREKKEDTSSSKLSGIVEQLAVEALREKIEGGAGARNWKEMAVTAVAENLPSIGNMFSGVVQGLRTTPRSAPPTPSAPAPHRDARQDTLPAATGIDSPLTDNPAPPAEQDPEQELQGILSRYSGFVINAIVQKAPGGKLADMIETAMGAITYDRLYNFGVDGLYDALYRNPQLGPPLRGLEPQVRKFVEEFIAYGAPAPPRLRPPAKALTTATKKKAAA